LVYATLTIALPALVAGCNESDKERKQSSSRKSSTVVVEFPSNVEPEDPTVSAFVRGVIDTCIAGDYNAFRLLWSIKEDPFPRDAFQRGWRAVRRVQIVRIEKFRRRAENDIVYGVHAHVIVDPAVRKPDRDVVLLIVREDDQWRLIRAPGALRRRFLGPDEGPDEAADDPGTELTTTTQPTSQPGHAAQGSPDS
jgi:hypothetical protein